MHRASAAAVAALLALSIVPLASAQSQSISGQVLDQDGAPVVGASVQVYQYGSDGASCQGENCSRMAPAPGGASATTDADGRFSVAARQGWAEIHVWKEGHASHYDSVEVDGAETLTIELVRFPEKTAQITGTVRGGSAGLPFASISVENPVYGVYECSQRASDASAGGASGGGSGGSSGSSVGSEPSIAPDEPYRGDNGCAILVQDDGSYAGYVTPGYSIIRFHAWSESQQYYGISRVVELAADQTTALDVQLTPRPGPDAVLGGHVVDKDSQQAIPGAQIGFSSQDGYDWASAQTDEDGSYRVRLRSGYTQLHVWADGYLPWEGQVTVRASEDGQRFTIELTRGQARYGGCCIAYAEGAPMAADMRAGGGGEAAGATGASSDSAGQEAVFQDLGGGLGPYDPAQRDAQMDGQDAPGFGALALVLALAALVLVVRRR